MSDAPKTKGLAAKMAAAMAEIGRVQKRGKNDAQGYKYARADDVAEEARRVLSTHGIAMFADVVDDSLREITIPPAKEGFGGKVLRISKVRVAWTFQDSETGEERTVHTPGEGMDSGDKGIYKAMTGAMKYALMLGFLIPTGDGDPEKASEVDAEVYAAEKPAPKTRVDSVKEKVAAANGKGVQDVRMPKDAEARKQDLKARTMALGFKGADLPKKLGEWIGRDVDAATVFTPDDWLKADASIAQAKTNKETLARASANMEAAGLAEHA